MKLQYKLTVLIAAVGCSPGSQEKEVPYTPNILWIHVEDISSNLSCYGETTIDTPNIDKLASEGELFENTFVTNPVCSASRSAIFTGMYQTTTGTHNHRSQREEGKGSGNEAYYDSYQLPEEIPFLPRLFKEAGYYTVLGDENTIYENQTDPNKLGKTDYNFIWNTSLYDANDWKYRKPGQPFFAQIQLSGGKFRKAPVDNPVNPDNVKLPPYYPDDKILRNDWAEYLNSIIYLDQQVKDIVDRLESEGIADSTVVFFFSDHGISHLRGKQFLYEDGIKVPLIVRWPELINPGIRRDDLVEHIDISATSLFLAGIPIPDAMQGQSFYGDDYQPRDFIHSSRDRCDETVDLIRSIRTGRFKYIRNFFPHKPHSQPNQYKYLKEIIQHLQNLYDEGDLKKETERYFEPSRPVEELYDLKADPHENHNLVQTGQYTDTLNAMRDMLMSTLFDIKDLGFVPEPVLEELGLKYGNKYNILRHPDNKNLLEECIEVIQLDEQKDIEGLIKSLAHERPAVRFWAAYGLGNIPELENEVVQLLTRTLNDESDAVRIAAARALCLLDHPDPALQILAENLDNSNLITGFYASLFIEDLDKELIKRVLPSIEKAKENPYEFTRRVARRLSSGF